MTLFSVLDQAPVRAGATAAQSIRDVSELARLADRVGYHRFWIAEHHALGAVASSAPEALIGHIAEQTQELRVGSGGVLLPNHRPLHVAEVFLTLAALYPGRIDLGVGRSEGTLDDSILTALARPQNSTHETGYERQLDELLSFLGARPLPAGDHFAELLAGPTGASPPPVFMLGSTPASAATAARKGLPYAFAAYTNPGAVGESLRLYRERFQPAPGGDDPHAIVGLKVVVGADDEHARALARPWHLAMVKARAGARQPLMSVEDALSYRLTDAELDAERRIDTRADVVGGPRSALQRIEEIVADTGADEVIVTTNTFDPADRFASYNRLAAAARLRARRKPPFTLPGLEPWPTLPLRTAAAPRAQRGR